jgi:hypothetical protein
MQLETLIGSPLTGIEACEPWAKALTTQPAVRQDLAGVFVLTFGSGQTATSLLCTSPLRHLHCPKGTVFGLASGDAVSLGYRLTLCYATDASVLRIAATPIQWSPWTRLAHSATAQTLTRIDVTAEQWAADAPSWGIDLTFASGQRLRLSYRADLDGCIELATPGHHFQIDRIMVDGPEQNFGWLHPAAPLDFILDDQVWRSAKVADWPHALRKALQSHQSQEAFYRQTMRRALMARFRQQPLHLQRLLALRYPVQVKDVPDGLIEEIAHAFAQRS